MGYYTQAAASLNINSIGDGFLEAAKMRLESAKAGFEIYCKEHNTDINWSCCKWTQIQKGGNGSLWISFGTEMKNYSKDVETWLLFLLDYFPSAEGIAYFVEENSSVLPKIWYIRANLKLLNDRKESGTEHIELDKSNPNQRVTSLTAGFHWLQGYGNWFETSRYKDTEFSQPPL